MTEAASWLGAGLGAQGARGAQKAQGHGAGAGGGVRQGRGRGARGAWPGRWARGLGVGRAAWPGLCTRCTQPVFSPV